MRHGKLDRGMIVAAAIELLKARGLQAVSLRNVAAAVGARAPSLYWHVSDKRMLYGLMAEAIYRRCLSEVPPATSWQQWFREFGRALWRTQRSIRDIPLLILQGAVPDEVLRTLNSEILDRVEALGLERGHALEASRAVQAFVTGWTVLDYGAPVPDASEEASFRDNLDRLIRGWES